MKKLSFKAIAWVIVFAFMIVYAPFGFTTAHASGEYWKDAYWWSSPEITSGDYVYRHLYMSDDDHTQNSPYVDIVNYTGAGGHVTVPASLDGFPVGCIFVDSFGNHDDITEITISEGITDLGWSVFVGCDNLEKITFPSTMVNFSSGVFEDCPKLATLAVSGAGAKLKSIDNVIYTNTDPVTLLAYAPGKQDVNFTIPDGVSTIADDAFNSANNLKTISVPDGVLKIGDKELSGGIRGGEVFNKADNLEAINVAASNPNYASQNGVLYSKDIKFLFRYPTAKTDSEFSIPGTVETVLVNSFIDIRALTKVNIPASVSKFEIVGINGMLYNPFDGCDNLEKITLDSGNTYLSMNNGALYSKDGTKLIAYPAKNAGETVPLSTLQYMKKQNVFVSGGRQGNYNVPDTTNTIISRAFSGCQLATVTIPASVTTIEDDAFKNAGSVIICGYTGTKAEEYAAKNGMLFVDITKGTLPAPDLSAHSNSYNSIRLEWGGTDGIDFYEIYRKDGNTYKSIAVTKDNYYVNTGLSTGTEYTYRVRGYVDNTPKVYSEYSSVISVKPVPAAPETVKATSSTYNGIQLTWSKVEGCTKYEVWRSASESGTYSLIKTTTSKSYTNDSLKTGATYYYKVRAYSMVGKTKAYGDYSEVVFAKPMLANVAKATAKAYSPTAVKISWSKVSGRSGYEVWSSTSSDGTYTLLKSTTGTTYNNINLTPSVTDSTVTYYYKVRAYRTVSGTKVYSDFTVFTSATPTLADVTGVKAVRSSSTKIKISWNKVSGCSGYDVLRSMSADGEFTLIKSIPSKSYTDTNLSTGTTYYYKVRAYVKVRGVKVYSALPSAVSATP